MRGLEKLGKVRKLHFSDKHNKPEQEKCLSELFKLPDNLYRV